MRLQRCRTALLLPLEANKFIRATLLWTKKKVVKIWRDKLYMISNLLIHV